MKKVPIIKLNNYKIIKTIGEGSFGKVYKVEKIDDFSQYAAKETKEEYNPKNTQCTFSKEILSYSKSDNPAILSLFGYSLSNFNDEPFPTMITEFMPKGSLDKILESQRHSLAPHDFTPTKKYIILLGISIGMKYLHSRGIIHRDLKPANILLNDELYPRICDFGCSFISDKQLTETLIKSEEVGTPMYMAPEIFSDEPYSYKVDVYAFSMLAYEIITGEIPFVEKDGVFNLLIIQK